MSGFVELIIILLSFLMSNSNLPSPFPFLLYYISVFSVLGFITMPLFFLFENEDKSTQFYKSIRFFMVIYFVLIILTLIPFFILIFLMNFNNIYSWIFFILIIISYFYFTLNEKYFMSKNHNSFDLEMEKKSQEQKDLEFLNSR